jgi:hypothetical protein
MPKWLITLPIACSTAAYSADACDTHAAGSNAKKRSDSARHSARGASGSLHAMMVRRP